MFVKLYLLTLPVFFAIDMVWLGLVANKFYQQQIGHLMAKNVNWPAALIFYFLFIAGLVYFVISPALQKQSLLTAVFSGALFGLMTYATYDLTNLATLKNWPILVTIIDLIWGMTLSVLVSVIVFFLSQKWLR
jgi:uncharacterized membrane protein